MTPPRDRGYNKLVIANWRDTSHPAAGGAEVVCEQLATRLAQMGHDVYLLTAAVAGRPASEQRDGFSIIRRGGQFTVYLWALLWLGMNRRRLDGVIDSQNGIPFFAPLVVRRRTPVVLLLHHVHQEQFAQYFSPLVSAIGRALERNVTRVVYGTRAIIAVSPSTRAGARRQLHLRGGISVVSPGCENPSPEAVTERRRAPHERIVCVGRLVAHKRTQLIIRAMSGLVPSTSDLELHIVGEGPERPALEALVSSLGLDDHVTFHGAVDDSVRDELMSSAWMTVNTSEGEGWGLSILEANALGVPALAYRRPGLRDSIRDGETGWLIDEGDDLGSAIAGALQRLADPVAARQMALTAQQWVARFSWDDAAAQVMTILRSEQGRLAHRLDNRRTPTDLASVVRIPTELIPDTWQPQFRLLDKWTWRPSGLTLLLPGTDTRTARLALHRANLPEAVVWSSDVEISVARPVDYVSSSAGGVAEPSSGPLDDETRLDKRVETRLDKAIAG